MKKYGIDRSTVWGKAEAFLEVRYRSNNTRKYIERYFKHRQRFKNKLLTKIKEQ